LKAPGFFNPRAYYEVKKPVSNYFCFHVSNLHRYVEELHRHQAYQREQRVANDGWVDLQGTVKVEDFHHLGGGGFP
jgi:hypothetical protein